MSSYDALSQHSSVSGLALRSPGLDIRRQIEEEKLSRSSHVLKSRIRRLRFLARLTSTALAIPTLILETFTLTTFYHTRSTIRDGRGPWAKETSLWPSIMLLSASGATVLLGSLILIAYLLGSIRKANQINMVNTTIAIIVECVHIGVWIGVSVAYREGRTGKDLWGWACGGTADSIQVNFEGVVDFNVVCKRGAVNWALSIANAGFTIFNLSIFYWVLKRRSYIKVQEQLAERRLLDDFAAS